MKIKIPKELIDRQGKRGKHKTPTLNEVIPYLPNETIFFDIRHLVYSDTIIPFSITTRVVANCQQYLKIYEDKDSSRH